MAYVSPGIDIILYTKRWYRRFEEIPCPPVPEFRVEAAEILRLPSGPPGPTGLLLVHGTIDTAVPSVLKALDQIVNHNPHHGANMRQWVESHVTGWADLDVNHRRAEHVTLLTSDSDDFPSPPGVTAVPAERKLNVWLASIAASGRIAPDHEMLTSVGQYIGMSANLRGLVNRGGISIVGLRADDGRSDGRSGFDYGGAQFFAQGLYSDVLLLGILQRVGLKELRDKLDAVRAEGVKKESLDKLQRELVDFRRSYWRTDFAPQGSQDDFLDAYHSQHRMVEELSELALEIGEYAGQVQRQTQEVTNAVLGLVAIVAFPISLSVAIWAGFEHRTLLQLFLFLVGGSMVSTGLFFLPGSRPLLRGLTRE
jgi:hypothetical protein